MKLEIKHLVPYLPYGLTAQMLDYKSDYVNKEYDHIVGAHQWDRKGVYWSALTVGGSKPEVGRIKPILRPLSDLTKEIAHNGETFCPMDVLAIIHPNTPGWAQCKNLFIAWNFTIGESIIEWCIGLKLAEWHFDFQGLIEAGLAIDINTL